MSDLRFEQAFIEHGWDERRREIRWQTWQAAILAERERYAKIADDRAKVLMGLAAKESGSLATSLRTAGEELKQLADAIRRGEGV